MADATRTCKGCDQEKDLTSFPLTPDGNYRRWKCYTCRTGPKKKRTDDTTHLTIDHVNGGGRASGDHQLGARLLKRIVDEGFPADYQILCFNCNFAKHAEGRCHCQDEVI